MDEKQEEMVQNAAQEGESQENAASDPLEEAHKELEEWKDRFLRAHADFENTKKRLDKDKSMAISYANESFATDILSVIDSFEQALASIKSADESNSSEVLEKMKEGVFLTYEQLKKVLEKNAIREIECEGEFDPNLHQAIMQIESDQHESGQIVQTLQKGYKIKDRVLRPSMVSTCK